MVTFMDIFFYYYHILLKQLRQAEKSLKFYSIFDPSKMTRFGKMLTMKKLFDLSIPFLLKMKDPCHC